MVLTFLREKAEELRSIEEINDKIRRGDTVVLTAEEMINLVESSGIEVADVYLRRKIRC